jgi:hypothetical protein
MPVLQPGDRARYVVPSGDVDGVRLSWGIIGHIVKGLEAQKGPLDRQVHDCYRVTFGAGPAGVQTEYLERE